MKTEQLENLQARNLAELKLTIAALIKDDTTEFPKSISYARGIEYDKYKITIEKIDKDYFVDAKGVKWVKVQMEDDES